MERKQKFPPPKVIAVDVDDTLQVRGFPNLRLIEWCREKKRQGYFLMLWSSRGQRHAENYAKKFGVLDIFDLICSKPGYVVDDQGWGWVKYTKVIRSFGCEHDDLT
jgi:hydroxymethylpyrimidine pyrophosphatase-like HAD family hydrolase